MSCNGCRVLRKGCSDDCALRPCLQWIKTPEAQGNATVFLAKFYGRAGLINLINAAPDHLRHEVFRSLLYEACGRIINQIYGSVGLIWAGKWDRCQAAVEAVLQGAPIMQVHSHDARVAGEEHPIMPLKGCDIRHVGKTSSGLNNRVLGVRTRNRFKRSGSGGKVHHQPQQLLLRQVESKEPMSKFSITGWEDYDRTVTDDGGEEQFELQKQLKRAPSPSHDSFSVETVEPSLLKMGRIVKCETHVAAEEDADLVLDLTLGFNPVLRSQLSSGSATSL